MKIAALIDGEAIIFDSEDVPVVVEFVGKDRENIANMAKGATVYGVGVKASAPNLRKLIDIIKPD